VRNIILRGLGERREEACGGLQAQFVAQGLGESRHDERKHGGLKGTVRPRPSSGSADSSMSDDN
jgi:hypothetical protein